MKNIREKTYSNDGQDYHRSERHKKKYKQDDQKPDTSSSKKIKDEIVNLIEFSFLDHRHELNKVLTGYHQRECLVDDPGDFWLFVQKYEAKLKKSGNCALRDIGSPKDGDCMDYDNKYNINLTLKVPFTQLYSRIPNYNHSSNKITETKLRHFLQILHYYLDFRQKEKFIKLKKIRKMQSELPVAQYKDNIIEAVRDNQVVIIAADTGAGKSTQVPQYLYEMGFEKIACTQPRRIACISLSKRVAHEMLSEYVSDDVGYQIRFERSKNLKTRILFITEGLLLRQLSIEENLSQYDVIVLDEIHERHLHGDFLLGIAKCMTQSRPDLKLILMSATINVKLFDDFFANRKAHIVEIPGRLYPIKLHYMPQFQDNFSSRTKSDRLNPEPYIQIMQLIDNKCLTAERGDLLIFLSGLNEIISVVDAATEYATKNNNWIILPLHSSLSIADQDKVFDYAPDGMRKCIISTNIAETSVTIDGIRFVVDSGKVKEMSYDSNCKMSRLKEFWISKASAEQRKGRAGRTGPGVCYRLYSAKDFDAFDSYTTAEILKVPLESLLLQMMAMGLPNARLFPFVETPPLENIENSILSLKQHDALTTDEKLTKLGLALSKIPVDISIGKMLLMGCVFRQLQPVLTMAAALSVQSPFTNTAYRDRACEEARKDLESDHGDPITLLNVYKEWLTLKQSSYENRKYAENTKQWCRRRGLEEQRFYEITKLRNQFQDLLQDCELMEIANEEVLSSSERAIRNGELRQLRELRRAHKMQGPRKRKLLKSDPWGLDNNDEDDGKVDIRDVEFRLTHDTSKIQDLVSGATACSYRDLMTLKLILVSGLYPQIAVPEEFNHCKNDQFFHTRAKPYTCLHPMGFFANHPQVLKLEEIDILEKSGLYKSKLPLSAKHQLLCYLSLLETKKPYLMNTLRMPAAQTLLLFGHTIETNMTFSRIICDSWLCLDFPVPETGQNLLYKASKLRSSWNKLLSNKLQGLNRNVDTELTATERTKSSDVLEAELWQDLANYMNSEVYYTIKRILVADLTSLFKGPSEEKIVSPNPFSDDFECVPNSTRGGIYLSEYIVYNCVKETDWSWQIASEIMSQAWICPDCGKEFMMSGLEKLQHTHQCHSANTSKEINEPSTSQTTSNQEIRPNTKKYECPKCGKTEYLTNVEILKHRKHCQ